MIGRRELMAAGVVVGGGARAQSTTAMRRLAIVSYERSLAQITSRGHRDYVALHHELEALGRVENRTLLIERWTTAGLTVGANRSARLRAYAELLNEVASGGPDVIFLDEGILASAMIEARGNVPFVYAVSEIGVIWGMQSPRQALGIPAFAGHVDRSAAAMRDLPVLGSVIGLLKELVPNISEIVLLTSELGVEETFYEGLFDRLLDDGLQPRFLRIAGFPLREQAIVNAVKSLVRSPPAAILVPPANELLPFAATIARAVTQAGLPGLALQREYAETGLLMSYEQDREGRFRAAARNIDWILRGADRGNRPRHAIAASELTINVATADALGLTASLAKLTRFNPRLVR